MQHRARILFLAIAILAGPAGLASAQDAPPPPPDQADAKTADAPKPPMQAVDLATVGVEFSVPEGTIRQPARSPYMVYVGTLDSDRRTNIRLYCRPLGKVVPANVNQNFAEAVAKHFIEVKGKNDQTFLLAASDEFRAAGKVGWRAEVTSKSQADEGLVVTAWDMIFPTVGMRAAYVLEVYAHQGGTEQARAYADLVFQSSRTVPLKQPWDIPLPEKLFPIRLRGPDVVLPIPPGWYLRQTGRTKEGFAAQASVTAIGQREHPLVNLLVYTGTTVTAEQLQDKGYIEQACKSIVEDNPKVGWEFLASRQASLGGLPALEIRGRANHPDSGKQAGVFLTFERRTVHDGKLVRLIVSYPEAGQTQAKTLLQRASDQLDWLEPSTQPAEEDHSSDPSADKQPSDPAGP